MCRIAGIISNNRDWRTSGIEPMRDAMHRGGPDDQGAYNNDGLGLSLAHRRLSLLDLSPLGHQPMFDPEATVGIVYNGEIYNFPELRAELEQRGIAFRSHSDTEVILQAYKAWGTAAFARFDGMFAFALLDLGKQELLLVRDPMGIKPLYIGRHPQGLCFASEVRAFTALDPSWPEHPDWRMAFMAYGFLPEPLTTLKNVHSLEPGHLLRIDLRTGAEAGERYFRFDHRPKITTVEAAIPELQRCLDAAVARHMIADAPLGVFLSGGIDSSLLTALARRHRQGTLHTLSVSFSESQFSELKYQQLVADRYQTTHRNFEVSEEEFYEELPQIRQAFDLPSIDGINTYFISKYARRTGLKAVLSGLGADELWGGYASFGRTATMERLLKMPGWAIGALAGFTRKDNLKRIDYLRQKDQPGRYLFNRGIFTYEQIAGLLGRSAGEVKDFLHALKQPDWEPGLHPQEYNSLRECEYYMRNQLLRDSDVMAMWHGLEIRVPFLDLELVQLARNISPELKFGGPRPKWLLIEAFNDLMPREVWDRPKQGFTFPFALWLRQLPEPELPTAAAKALKENFYSGKTHWSKYWAYANAQPGKKI